MNEDFNISLAAGSRESKTKSLSSRKRSGILKSMLIREPIKKRNFKLLLIVIFLFLFASAFQTVAWYFNIDGKYKFGFGLMVSLTLVFFEYLCLTKANQWGYRMFTIFQLGLLAELVNWVVFLTYLKFYRKEKIENKMWLSLGIMSIAIYIAYS
jgi:uncharacterized protein (DUF486 family)